jgi:hypothetical protein
MANNETSKIFRIEIPGLEQLIGKVQQLNQEIGLTTAVMKEAKKKSGCQFY